MEVKERVEAAVTTDLGAGREASSHLVLALGGMVRSRARNASFRHLYVFSRYTTKVYDNKSDGRATTRGMVTYIQKKRRGKK